MSSWNYSNSTESNLMKVKYGKLIEKQFAQDNILFARIKIKKNFVGSQIEKPIIQSIGGGVGAGSLPTASESQSGKATITSKKLYAVTSIDRETMKAAKSDEGSFVRMTAFPVKAATKAFNRNLERQLVRGGVAGDGALITGVITTDSDVTGDGSVGDPFIVSFDTANRYFPAQFESIEVGDILNAATEATELLVTAMSVTVSGGYATGTITLQGSSVVLAADEDTSAFVESLYMQNSKDNEISGIQGALAATSGNLYSLAVGRRYQAYQKNASSAALSTDLMNDVVINVKRQSGESPKLILCAHHQYIKLLNLLEDQKVYNLPAKDKKFKGQVSFSALEYMSADGPIPVVASRFVDGDKMYFLNESHIELNLRPGGFEWFDEDGTVFLRETSDAYEARYGGYGQSFINPHFQGYLYGLGM